MAWSTRQLAEMAGTTINAVRHYHREGLLDEPQRSSNGYKQYGVGHLVRLLQIRRLRDLGVPLDRIEQLSSAGPSPREALEAILADLTAGIERLVRARAGVVALLEGSSIIGAPAGFESVADKMSPPERSLSLIYGQFFDDDAMADVRQMLEDDPADASESFAVLPADADEAAKAPLIERYVAMVAENIERYPWLVEPFDRIVNQPRSAQEALVQASAELYNPAQLDVVVRASRIALARVAERGGHS